MRLATLAFLALTALPLGAFAQDASAWATGQRGNVSFATARGEAGITAIVSFEKGKPDAQMLITGLWNTRPLALRLSVIYANGRRVPMDTFRFGEVAMLNGKRAYKLRLKTTALRPLRGGDTLVIEDLTRRATVPLTGSSKALQAAEAASAG